MSNIDFHLPKIGRDLKQPKEGLLYSEKPYAPIIKVTNSMEAYRASPQRKKYQNMLISILNPKVESSEPRGMQTLNNSIINNEGPKAFVQQSNNEPNTTIISAANNNEQYSDKTIGPRLKLRAPEKRNFSIDFSSQKVKVAEKKTAVSNLANIFKVSVTEQNEFSTPLLRKPNGLQGPQFGIADTKTDRLDQSGLGPSLAFLKPQGKIPGNPNESDPPIKLRKASFLRPRVSPNSNSLEIPSVNISTDPVRGGMLNQTGNPAHTRFKLVNSRPEEKIRSKVNTEILLSIHDALKKLVDVNIFYLRARLNHDDYHKNGDAPKEIVKYGKKYLELIDKQEFYDIDLVFLDPKTRKDFKAFIVLERIAIFAVLSVMDSGSNSIQIIKELLEAVYTNFVYFLDLVISIIGSVNKQSAESEQLAAVRAKIKLGTGSVGACNDKIIKGIKSMKFSENDLNDRVNHLIQKISQVALSESHNFMKQIFSGAIMRWKVNVAHTNQTKKPEPAQPSIDSNASKLRAVDVSMNGANSTEKEALIKDKKEEQIAKSSDNNSEKTGLIKPKNISKDVQPKNAVRPIEKQEPAPTQQKTSGHLPPIESSKNDNGVPIYSLVLDLDETLVHYEEVGGKGKFFVRPYAELFLRELSEYYELVVFTAAMQDYADIVLNILDKRKYINHRLYRQHTTFASTKTGVIKDLSKIGRDLSKVIIIDNSPDNFVLQPDNGIEIKSWFSDPYDHELLDLIPFLKDICAEGVEDVRKALRKWKQQQKK